MKKYSLKVENVGRKYVQCRDNYNRIIKVEINNSIKALLSSNKEELVVFGDFCDFNNGYGVNRVIKNAMSVEEHDKKLEKLNRKWEIEKIQNRAFRMLNIIENNIEYYWYKNGEKVVLESIEELKKLNIDATDFENRLANLKNKYSKSQNTTKVTKTNKTFTDRKYYEENSIVKVKDKYVRIISMKVVRLSRDEVEAMYGGYYADECYYDYREVYEYSYTEDVTDKEIENVKNEEQKKEIEKQEKQAKKENFENAEKDLYNYIRANSILEEKSDKLDDKIEHATVISDRLKITETELLFLIPNWGDGDNWDNNNCKIGICRACKLTEELKTLLEKYLTAKEAM